MAKIRTFARIKPADDLYDDFDTTRNRLYMRIPDSYSRDSTLYNRTRAPIVNHEFKYSQVFTPKSTQQEVFDVAAKTIIDGFLDGYNGTIFAYGQTASGKTYTMHGDLTDSEHKGLAPRSLTRIFSAINARKEAGENISMHCSFLEIYQEVGYDLFKPAVKNGPGAAGFAKVAVVDGPQGAAVVKNLSILAVNSEEAAQTLLAQGELNRKVAETAMNNRSSRSHAVFTVYLSSRKRDMLVRSKMHFVDLAGSERVCKTGVKGLQLSEAKYINLSLHYLEGVIIALHQDATSSGRTQAHTAPTLSKSWSSSAMAKRPYSAADTSGRPRHIPYRNSLLTMLLKDSLGGNCLTTMIATISLELTNLSESISTCRFAQRVSCISNIARKNEEIDDKSMIKKLRTRVAELEAENNLLKHGGQADLTFEDPENPLLSADDKKLCQHVVKDFLNGKLVDPIVAGVTDPYKFRECMSIFKKLIKEHSEVSIRLAERLKQQPTHIQEAFFTGGRYHEAPLAKPSQRQQIHFRDDANALTRNAYASWVPKQQKGHRMAFRPTILKSSEGRRQEVAGEAWQLQIKDDAVVPKSTQGTRPKPQSAGAALHRVTTPFERKRNQEVTQLNKKVETRYAEQQEQANHLKAFKKTIAEQELEVNIQSLQRKLEVTQHQLADQHAYTLKLSQQKADKDLLEQEQLVKRQLQKRMDKINTELKAAKERLVQLTEGKDDSSNKNNVQEYRSVKDKFSKMTKKDGTIDAVKVKTTLEHQEKLQKQLQKKIDQQRAMAINKHLEVQELSTRQKLEEFKRKLAESRESQRSQSSDTSPKISSSNAVDVAVHESPVSHSKSDKIIIESPSVKGSQASFQSRIQHEKPSREQSINEILRKYRSGASDPKQVAVAEQRTNQVDQILAKYKKVSSREADNRTSRVKTTKTVTKSSANASALGNNSISREKSMPVIPEQKVVDEMVSQYRKSHTTIGVKVPNSAMEYESVRIDTAANHPAAIRPESQPSHRENGVYSTVGVDVSHQRSFQETLDAMLAARPGQHKKRADAWASTGALQKEREKQDILKEKLQQYLSKQSKRKRQENISSTSERISTSSGKSRSRSRNPHSQVSSANSQRANHKRELRQNGHRHPQTDKSTRHESSRSHQGEQRGTPSAEKRYSHRINHYQKSNNDSVALTTQNTNNEAPSRPSIPEVVHPTSQSETSKEYTNLRKLSRRNEHTMQVRRIQNAAMKIQRAWRRSRLNT